MRALVSRDEKQMLLFRNNKCRLKCFTKFTENYLQKNFKEYWGMSDLQRQHDRPI